MIKPAYAIKYISNKCQLVPYLCILHASFKSTYIQHWFYSREIHFLWIEREVKEHDSMLQAVIIILTRVIHETIS